MRLGKKLKNFLIFLILISFTSAYAAPNVQRVFRGSIVEHTGWCLSDSAMAKIVADKEQEEERCQLKVGEQKEKLEAKYDLEISNLELRIESLQSELDTTTKVKDEQIQKLEKIALDKPNNYWYLFTAGGFVMGVGVTVGIVYILGL